MIRRGNMADRPGLEALYDLCFPGEADFRQWFFDRVWKPENTLLLEENGSIPAATQLLPGWLRIGGERYPAGYIWAAGTHPDHRGKGMMGALLRHSFEEGAARGTVFSTLITENDTLFDFYRPFGYTTIARVARRTIAPARLPEGFTAAPALSCHYSQMIDLYDRATGGLAAPVRDLAYFALMGELYGENLVVLLDHDNTVKAYCFMDKRQDKMVLSEAVGDEALPRYLADRYGCRMYQHPATDGEGAPIGCIKALTPGGQALLDGLTLPPYLNILFN